MVRLALTSISDQTFLAELMLEDCRIILGSVTDSETQQVSAGITISYTDVQSLELVAAVCDEAMATRQPPRVFLTPEHLCVVFQIHHPREAFLASLSGGEAPGDRNIAMLGLLIEMESDPTQAKEPGDPWFDFFAEYGVSGVFNLNFVLPVGGRQVRVARSIALHEVHERRPGVQDLLPPALLQGGSDTSE